MERYSQSINRKGQETITITTKISSLDGLSGTVDLTKERVSELEDKEKLI